MPASNSSDHRAWRRCLTYVLAAVASAWCAVALAQGTKPPVCDDPSSSFAPGARKSFGGVHQDVITLVGSRVQERSQKAGALVPAMRGLLESARRQRGDGSLEAALLRSDLADLLEIAPNPDSQEIATIRRTALSALIGFTMPEAVEVAIVLGPKVSGTWAGPDAYASALAVLQRHRRAAGDVPRSMPLWTAAMKSSPSPAVREGLAREQLAAAQRSGDARWSLGARADLIDAIVHSAIGKSFQDLELSGKLRDGLVQSGPHGGEILMIARAMLPELRRRQAWLTGSETCRWLGFGETEYATKTLLTLGTGSEGREALGVVVRVAARSALDTNIVDALNNLAPIFAAKAIDRDLYLEGMRLASGAPDAECEVSARLPEICAMRTAAGAYVSIGDPGAAILLLRDAVDVAERGKVDPVALGSLLIHWAEIEWSHGTASEAPAILKRAEMLLRLGAGPPRTPIEVRALRLRAIIADAQLDDATALNAYDRIVSAAIVANRKLSQETAAVFKVNMGADPLKQESYNAAVELTTRHLRRRFCTGCAAEGEVARPALDWLAAVFDARNTKGFVPRPADFLLLKTLPETVWPSSAQRQAQEQFRRALIHQGGQDGAGVSTWLAAVSSRMPPGADASAHLRTLALSAIVTSGDFRSDAEPFMAFLGERDLDRKRRLWTQYLEPIADTNFDQFGADTHLNETLDELARGAAAAGYGLAARVVHESLLERVAKGASSGLVAEDGPAKLQGQAGLVVPAMVRVAGYAMDRREWVLAHRLLDLAASVVRGRLASEWTAGGERAVASLRELRGAVRLLSQLRAKMVDDPASRAAVADGPARLFADLQLAMLGETALVTQAVDRRRIENDAALSAAIGERNALTREIAITERLRFPAERWGVPAVGERISQLTMDRQKAIQVINRLLPVPEDLVSPSPVPLAEAQRVLAADEGLLILHAGTDAVYGFLVAAGRPPTTWTARIGLKDLEARIGILRAGVDLTGGTLPRFPFQDAAALYDILLRPVHEALTGVRHVLLVADGPLQSLPLSILLTERPSVVPVVPNEIRSARMPWLARRHAVTVLTSARAVVSRNAVRLASRAIGTFAGVGNPVLRGVPGSWRGAGFVDMAPTPAALADVEALRRMPALPDTETELRAIGRRLDARVQDILLGASATELAVKRMPLAQYRVITFATHGLIAGTASGGREPGLVMTPPMKATAEDDGYLSASEIAALKLDADLVILSACNTASSDGRARAEGLSGLARAFLSAGARSVVATHWAIPSAPSVEITTRMVAGRREGGVEDWGRLLQLAMIEVIDEVGPVENAHPANWGAFIAVGLPQKRR